MSKAEASSGGKKYRGSKKTRVNNLAHPFVETATHDMSVLESNTSMEEILTPGEAKLVISLLFFLPTQFLFNFLN